MRSRTPRLAGIATAAALALSPLAAAPAYAAPSDGTIVVTIVDDLGKPVAGAAMLYPADSSLTPIALGDPGGSGAPRPATSFNEPVEAGTYGIVVMGGWGGLTCVGLSDCSVLQMMGASADATLTPAAITVTEGGSTAVTVTVATPKLTGTPALGSPLTVTVPKNLTDLTEMLTTMTSTGGGSSPFFGMGTGSEPTVTWRRNGVTFGETGSTYVPSRADAAATLTATVSYPPVASFFFTYQGMASAIPGSFTTAPVSFGKLKPQLTISSPKRFKRGQRPVVYVNAQVGESSADGVVGLRVGKRRAQQAVLRSGLVAFKLPQLKPGKYTLTATFAGSGQYDAATASSTTVVKARKHGKGKKKHT